tara:strand:+ start:285 stop:1178 length:894 start_codon:yes stop_codon:yes gene_type:complete
MKEKLAFEIKNLKCKYEKSPRPVLEIDSLEIEKESITFLIGTSGSGKSTILESMGLMNNTLINNNSLLNFYATDENGNNKVINYFELWKKDEKEISKHRRNYFSFIFQSNNLFQTLDGYQNIIMPAILQGKSIAEGKKIASTYIQEILKDINPNTNKKFDILRLSGGQKQRLAFIRAMIGKFSVLFADEPTGNLDWYNAEKIMNFLKEKKIEKKATVIIVSHDIELAVNTADKIIFINRKEAEIINKNNEKEIFSYGQIDSKSEYIKKEGKWILPNKEVINQNDLVKELKEKFKPQN